VSKRAEATRERILDSTAKLLLDRGYGATSIEAVCNAAGVTKGGLFYHFDSKEQLTSAAIEQFFAGLVAAGESERPRGDSGAVEALDAYIASLPVLIRGPMLAKGCLLGAMAMQTTESHPEVHSSAKAALGEWRGGLVALFEAAAKQRRITVDAGELADGLLAAVEGGLLLDRSGVSPGAAVAAVNHFRSYVSTVFPQEKSKRGAKK
jgi:TetR/AcrR family transcriptional regulator, transcriptional repressor for nem operon